MDKPCKTQSPLLFKRLNKKEPQKHFAFFCKLSINMKHYYFPQHSQLLPLRGSFSSSLPTFLYPAPSSSGVTLGPHPCKHCPFLGWCLWSSLPRLCHIPHCSISQLPTQGSEPLFVNILTVDGTLQKDQFGQTTSFCRWGNEGPKNHLNHSCLRQ